MEIKTANPYEKAICNKDNINEISFIMLFPIHPDIIAKKPVNVQLNLFCSKSTRDKDKDERHLTLKLKYKSENLCVL